MRYPYRPGTVRVAIPWQFYGMTRDQIVETLVQYGYPREMVEREVDQFLVYRDGPVAKTSEEVDRNDSVSGNSILGRLRSALQGRK